LVLLGVLAVVVLTGSAAAAPVGWGTAIEAPGTASLNGGGYAQVASVSCSAPTACVAGGWYKDGSGHVQAFVVSERHGHWGSAIEVPGTAALNHGDAEVTSVSCGAAGACAAGGWYMDTLAHFHAFVVSQTRGRWGTAVEVPGMDSLNHGPEAEVTSVSCSAAGACVAGGDYSGQFHHLQAFAVSEIHGRWGQAMRLPGTALVQRHYVDARVSSVSCGAVGACVAGGFFTDGSGDSRAFVATMKHGRWGRAVEVASTTTLNLANAAVTSASCAGAGACVVAGDAGSSGQAFVMSEAHGRWGHAVAVSGPEFTADDGPQVTSVSCVAAGACVAGGLFTDDLFQQAFIVSSTHGHWGRAIEVPGIVALNTEGEAKVTSVSCAAPGTCVAGGRYLDDTGHYQAFVVSETRGRWRNAVQVSGMPTLNYGDSQVNAVSCAPVGLCAAGGTYQDGTSSYQAFVGIRP
jgi:hypothetical protein